MAKGRPADPTRAKRQTGHRPKPGEAKVAKAPPPALVTPQLPSAPQELSPEAALMFDRIVAELAPRGLRDADLEAVAMMVHSAAIHHEARRKLAETGVLVKGPRGPMVNPLIKVARDEAATYLRLANEFGLTLASRLRLGLMQLAGESIIGAMNRDLDEQASTSVVIKVDP